MDHAADGAPRRQGSRDQIHFAARRKVARGRAPFIVLFMLAALAEIGGAWLVWRLICLAGITVIVYTPRS